MEVRIHELQTRVTAQHLLTALDDYLAQVTSDFRDGGLPEGAGERLLERALGSEQGLVLVAEDPATGSRIGVCVVVPFQYPLLQETHPIVAVLSVERDARHRGMARRLIEVATRTLEARGCATLGALVGHNDDALISMGERWGFVRLWEFMLRE